MNIFLEILYRLLLLSCTKFKLVVILLIYISPSIICLPFGKSAVTFLLFPILVQI